MLEEVVLTKLHLEGIVFKKYRNKINNKRKMNKKSIV